MKSSLQVQLPPMALNTLDSARAPQAKARLKGQSSSMDGQSSSTADLAGQAGSIALTLVVKDALIRHYGSLKAAAITFRMDPGQLTRDLQSGDFKLKKLDMDEEAKAFVVATLHDAFVGGQDPKARVQRLIRQGRQILDELAEAL